MRPLLSLSAASSPHSLFLLSPYSHPTIIQSIHPLHILTVMLYSYDKTTELPLTAASVIELMHRPESYLLVPSEAHGEDGLWNSECEDSTLSLMISAD